MIIDFHLEKPTMSPLPLLVILTSGPGLVRVLLFAISLLLMVLLLSIVFEQPAHAAELGILDQLRPALGDLVAIALTALVAYAVQRFQAWTGIEIEARHREALQSALANAARKIIGGSSIYEGVEYVENSVPDALKHLGVDGADRIRDLLQPHISGLTPALSKG